MTQPPAPKLNRVEKMKPPLVLPISEGDLSDIKRLSAVVVDAKIRDGQKFKRPPEYEQLKAIYNRLSGGRLLSSDYANHVIFGLSSRLLDEYKRKLEIDTDFREQQEHSDVFERMNQDRGVFNPDSRIDQEYFQDGFYFSVGGSNYLGGNSVIIFFGPDNVFLKKYLSAYLDRDKSWGEQPTDTFLDSFLGFTKNVTTELDVQGRFKFVKTKDEIRYPRWSDVADCIVDIPNKRVLFYT
jgi:hypothetical protein